MSFSQGWKPTRRVPRKSLRQLILVVVSMSKHPIFFSEACFSLLLPAPKDAQPLGPPGVVWAQLGASVRH